MPLPDKFPEGTKFAVWDDIPLVKEPGLLAKRCDSGSPERGMAGRFNEASLVSEAKFRELVALAQEEHAPEIDRQLAQETISNLNSQDNQKKIRGLAASHLRKLTLWFFGTFLVSFITVWLSNWAGDRGGWEGQTIQIVFGLFASIAFLTFMMFCILIYGWLRSYGIALRDLKNFSADPDGYFYRHREVFGPIPWG